MATTPAQNGALIFTVGALNHWIQVLDLVEKRLVALSASIPLDGPQAATEFWLAPHVLALALRHVDRRVRHLMDMGGLSTSGRTASEAFIDAYQSNRLKDLRDGFEHSDQYVTGKGRKPSIGRLPEGWIPHVVVSADSQHVEHIRLFGNNYPIHQVLRAVESLPRSISEWLGSP